MKKAYLLLGSNIGNRLANINAAILKIKEICGEIILTSSIYETAPWGYLEQDNFLNQAVVLFTDTDPSELMEQLLEIETEIGRIREFKSGPRIIDIDILLLENEIINEKNIILPHPELSRRRFALIPLAEVAGNVIHPVLHKSIIDILADCSDKGHVQKFS